MASSMSNDVDAYIHTVETDDGRVRQLKAALKRHVTYMPSAKDNEHLLDIGCGPGKHTIETVLPHYPNVKITGVDKIPEMIEYANKTNCHPNVTYEVFDIENKAGIPSEWKGKFAKVVSIHALHFVGDLSMALRNVNAAMCLKGTFSFNLLIRPTGFFSILEKLAEMESWKFFSHEIKWQIARTFQWDESPRKRFKRMAEEAGFDILTIDEELEVLEFESEEYCKEFLCAIYAILEKLSEDEKKRFLDDCMEVIKESDDFRQHDGKIRLYLSCLCACALKRKELQ